MRLPRVFHTSTFRLSIYFAAFFAASALALWGLAYWAISDFFIGQTDDRIDHDVAVFEQAIAAGGEPAIEALIDHEVATDPFETAIYQLFRPNGSRGAGNLGQALPSGDLPIIGRGELVTGPPLGARNPELHTIRIRTIPLAGGDLLLVGRDIYDPLEIRERVSQIIGFGLFGTVVLAGLGGWTVSRALLHRVDAIARASRTIIEGRLDRRLPVGKANDEFDQLAIQVNGMLERIETLMTDIRQVTSGIAHDLRSPLTRLRVRLEKAQLDRGEQADPVFDELIADVDGVRATFDALLRIAQIEARNSRSNFRTVDLGHLVDQATELYQTVAEDKGLTWHAAIEDRVLIQGDEQLLAQALSNLVENALKYTPAGGSISLRLRQTADRAELAIEDSGPGIPPSARASVLKHFVRLEESRSTPGSGLGLALVAAVAKFHGAELVLGDACPGLRISLLLPRD